MQETSVILFSHQLETLTEHFSRNIYSGSPFEKKMVIVPHLSLKGYLLQQLSRELGIGAGLKVVTLPQAVSLIFEKKHKIFPKFLELSLAIQHEIKELEENQMTAPLLKYLSGPSASLRLGQLSSLLSMTFIEYGLFGGEFLKSWLETPSWEQQLWQKIYGEGSWTYPYRELVEETSSPYSFHLFGFHFLSPLYLNFFKKMGSSFYFFSPCSMFWDDRLTQKEKVRLYRNNLNNRFLTTSTFSQNSDLHSRLAHEQWSLAPDQNFERSPGQTPDSSSCFGIKIDLNQNDHSPLLSNLGKVSRKFFSNVLDQDLIFEEDYPNSTAESLLEKLQRSIVEDQSPPDFADESIQIISASSRLHEIEILHDTLVSLVAKNGYEPHEIAVFAPDINEYAPFIHAVFSKGVLPYSISHLNTTHQAFKLLLQLPNEKFSKEALLELFAIPAFREKFQLSLEDLISIASWVEKAGIRWGLDERQRELLLGQKPADGHLGTWEMGLERLLWGIAKIDEGIVPLSEIETFDKLLRILRSLNEDLTLLFDGTERMIPDWIDLFIHLCRSYFNDGEDLIKDLASLQAMTSSLSRNKMSYESIQRILPAIFEKKTGSYQESHLHGMKFSSLISGAIVPSKILYILGMEEGGFPRKKRKRLFAPEFARQGDFYPTQVDEDRFLFLQILLSARKQLFLSYQKIAEDGQADLNPTVLIEELQAHIKSLTITHHQPVLYAEKKLKPLLPELYIPLKLVGKKIENQKVALEKLGSFAKHPLRFYFREILQMSVAPFEKNEEEEEFILSPLFKSHLKQKTYKEPLEELLIKSEQKGELPRGLFKKIAVSTMRQEVESLDSELKNLGVIKEEISTQEIDLQVAGLHIQGKIHGICSKGLIFHGENEMEDLVKIWPIFLVYLNGIKGSVPSILFTKSGEKKDFHIQDREAALLKYLEYFQLAQSFASPLLPKLAKPLLQGTIEELEKKLEEQLTSSFTYQDKVLKWLCDRDKMMNCEAIFHNWASILKEAHDFV